VKACKPRHHGGPDENPALDVWSLRDCVTQRLKPLTVMFIAAVFQNVTVLIPNRR